jgi:hypothetical protein
LASLNGVWQTSSGVRKAMGLIEGSRPVCASPGPPVAALSKGIARHTGQHLRG